MNTLTSQPVDGQRIFNNARDRLLRLFEAEAREAGLLPKGRTQQWTHEVAEGHSNSLSLTLDQR